MSRILWFVRLSFACALVAVVASCSSDDEESSISNLTVEICDLKTTAAKSSQSCMLDDDRTLRFQSPLEVSWASKSDSIYRALLYYNKVEGSETVEALSASYVPCLWPVKASDDEWSQYADPVDLLSAWMSKNGKYINLCVSIQDGVKKEGQAHKLAAVCDSIADGGAAKHYYLRFCHSQNGIPTYYGIETYVSVQTEGVAKGDTLTLSIPTFKGLAIKTFVK